MSHGIKDPVAPSVSKEVLPPRMHPNPSPGNQTIVFSLAEATLVRAAIYDISGRRLRTLFDGNLASGRQQLEWDGRNDRGEACGSGVYFVRVCGDKKDIIRRRIIVIRGESE